MRPPYAFPPAAARLHPWRAQVGQVALTASAWTARGQCYVVDPGADGFGGTVGRRTVFLHPDDVSKVRADMQVRQRMRRPPTDDEVAAWLSWMGTKGAR